MHCVVAYLLDVLALKLGEELAQTVGVSIDTDGGEDLLDVRGRGRLVASEVKQKVSGEVLHFECAVRNLVVSGFFETQRVKATRGLNALEVNYHWNILLEVLNKRNNRFNRDLGGDCNVEFG